MRGTGHRNFELNSYTNFNVNVLLIYRYFRKYVINKGETDYKRK